MPTAQEWLAFVERMAKLEQRFDNLEAHLKGSSLRLWLLITSLVGALVGAFGAVLAAEIARH